MALFSSEADMMLGNPHSDDLEHDAGTARSRLTALQEACMPTDVHRNQYDLTSATASSHVRATELFR